MRVCIIGASLSSLTLAKTLVNQNIYVDLFVSKRQYKPDQSRTIGISKSNVDYFNSHIIDIKKIIWKLKKIEIFTDNFKEENILNFENGKDELFSIVKYHELSKILEQSLFKNFYFKKFNKKVNLSFAKNYDLVFNTDASNHISKKYFNKKILKEYNSSAYTTIIKHEKIINDIAIQIFTKKGPLAFLPISESETSVVYSIHKSDCKKVEKMNDLINYYNLKYEIKKIGKANFFDLKYFTLRSYYHKNILAFGDLLHRIHPLAGQGFNMTIRDIKILSNIIKSKYSIGLPLDSSVNKEFENKSKHNNFIFSNGIDLIYEFFDFERKINSDILKKTVQLLGKNPSVNKIFTNIADKGIIF